MGHGADDLLNAIDMLPKKRESFEDVAKALTDHFCAKSKIICV